MTTIGTGRIDDVFRRLVLPGDKDALLLQWLLSDDPRPAFRAWLDRVGDASVELQSWLPAQRGLLPHLGHVVRQHDLPAPPPFLNQLRAAEIHESFRAETYRHVLDEIMRIVNEAGAQALYLLGVPMDALYPREGVRHHGVCMLALPSAQAAIAVTRALRSSGCELHTRRVFGRHVLLRHRSDLLVKVQVAFPLPALRNRFDEIYKDARAWAEPGVRAPSLPDTLLEIVAAVACDASRRQLEWLIDAYFCYRRMQPADRDVFKRSAEHAGLGRLANLVFTFLRAKIAGADPEAGKAEPEARSLSFAERLLVVSILRARRSRMPLTLTTYAAAPSLVRHAVWPGRDVAAWFSEQKSRPLLSDSLGQ